MHNFVFTFHLLRELHRLSLSLSDSLSRRILDGDGPCQSEVKTPRGGQKHLHPPTLIECIFSPAPE